MDIQKGHKIANRTTNNPKRTNDIDFQEILVNRRLHHIYKQPSKKLIFQRLPESSNIDRRWGLASSAELDIFKPLNHKSMQKLMNIPD